MFIQFDYAVHGGPSYSQFASKESRSVLKTDIDNGYILATRTVDEELMAHFFDVDIDAGLVIDYDKKLCEIEDKDFSEKFRILYFARELVMGIRSKSLEYIERIDQLEKEDSAFIDKFFDFAVRYCLTSGHERSDGLFDLLVKRPNLKERLSKTHQDFSLPYLLERDYYRKMLIFPGNEEEDLKKMKQIVEALNIDIEVIRKRLVESGNPREFMPEF